MPLRHRVNRYIPEIDGLRALAVIGVLLNHLHGPLLPGGFSGVDVFFVISGYVVTKSLSSTPVTHFGSYLAGFYGRRVLRILPALLVCLAVTTALTVLFIPQSWLSNFIPVTGLAAIFGVSNIALLLANDGYFAPQAEFNPFTHTWSLGVEEQFYLIYPLLLFLWLRWRESPSFWRRHGAQASLLSVGVASLILAIFFSVTNPDQAFYGLLSRFWQLAAGGLLFQVHWHGLRRWERNPLHRPVQQRYLPLLQLLGLLLIGLGFVVCEPGATPWPMGLLPVLGTLLMLHGCGIAPQPTPHLGRLLAAAPSRWLGIRSYGLYLWHWPVIVLLRWTVGLESTGLRILAAGLSLGLAMISYALIENPIRGNVRLKRLKNGWKFVGGLGCSLVVWLGASQAFAHQSRLSLSVTRDAGSWYSVSTRGLKVAPAAPDSGLAYAGRTVFVLGNSHAAAYATMLEEAHTQLGVGYRIHNMGACAMGFLEKPVLTAPGCKQAWQQVRDDIHQHARLGDLVVLASLRHRRFVDQWGGLFTPDAVRVYHKTPRAERLRRQGQAETLALVREFKAMRLKVLFSLPMPLFQAPPFRCSDWFNRQNPICAGGLTIDRSLLRSVQAPMRSLIIDTARRAGGPEAGVWVWDSFDLLCPGARCKAFAGNHSQFFDADHLSGFGNQVLYPSFTATLGRIWPSEARLTTSTGSS